MDLKTDWMKKKKARHKRVPHVLFHFKISFKKNPRKGNLWQKVDQWLPGNRCGGLTAKMHEGTYRCDGNVLYLDYCDWVKWVYTFVKLHGMVYLKWVSLM